MNHTIIKLSNAFTKARHSTCPPERLLLLFPSCLQRSGCDQNIRRDVRRAIERFLL